MGKDRSHFLAEEKKEWFARDKWKNDDTLDGLEPPHFPFLQEQLQRMLLCTSLGAQTPVSSGAGGCPPEGPATKSATAVHGREVRIHTP